MTPKSLLLKCTLLLLALQACSQSQQVTAVASERVDLPTSITVRTGADQLDKLLPLLQDKRVAITGNQTSVIQSHGTTLALTSDRQFDKAGMLTQPAGVNSETAQYVHLIDTLRSRGVDVVKAFAPEHGFRGTASAGEKVADGVDLRTGIPILSLYGSNKKPDPTQLEGIDVMVFDIQDVGVRFYTYISTLHYMMEACGAAGIPIIVLDRPNPNGHYTAGPILKSEHKSFVGMHPVPVAHGMSIGEYAQMIKGESWTAAGTNIDLTVIPVTGWSRSDAYHLPIPPSPNLPNDRAINLYPSLCFFEGTTVSAGRGTENQFQVYGDPELPQSLFPYTFTPVKNAGAKYPKHENQVCYGEDLRDATALTQLNFRYIQNAYKEYRGDRSEFFIPFLEKLTGDSNIREILKSDSDATKAIYEYAHQDLEAFKKMRAPYLLYE